MPQATQTPHPRDENIVLTFTEEDHRYVDNLDREYKSVTTLVKNQFPEFDTQAVAAKVAARDGCTIESVITGWDNRRDAACRYGTMCHEFAEYLLSDGKSGSKRLIHHGFCEKTNNAIKCIENAVTALLMFYDIIAIERVLFSPKYLVAGTADLIARNKQSGEIAIIDWKTNEEITDQHWEMGVGRCSKLPHCNKAHYSLQTSIYAEIMQQEGYTEPNEEIVSTIIHIPPFSQRPAWIALPEYRITANAILNDTKEGRTKQ